MKHTARPCLQTCNLKSMVAQVGRTNLSQIQCNMYALLQINPNNFEKSKPPRRNLPAHSAESAVAWPVASNNISQAISRGGESARAVDKRKASLHTAARRRDSLSFPLLKPRQGTTDQTLSESNFSSICLS